MLGTASHALPPVDDERAHRGPMSEGARPLGQRSRLARGARVVVDAEARALVPGLVDVLRTLSATVEVVDDARALDAVIVDGSDGPGVVLDAADDAGDETAAVAGLPVVGRSAGVSGRFVTGGADVFCVDDPARPVVDDALRSLVSPPPRAIVELPPMPGDHARRADAIVLPRDATHVVVPEVDEDAFEVVKLAHEVALGRLVQTFLDLQAAALAARGLAVSRLPTMPPIYLEKDLERPEGWAGIWLSPTQALTGCVEDRPFAILPRFLSEEFPRLYRGVYGTHLARWSSFFAREGFAVHTVDVELLVRSFRPLCRLARVLPASTPREGAGA